MFIVQVHIEGVIWLLEGGDYYCDDRDAIAAAKRRTVKDGAERRVTTWPDVREVWPTSQQQPEVVEA